MQRPLRRFPRIEADTVAYVKILGDRRPERVAWASVSRALAA